MKRWQPLAVAAVAVLVAGAVQAQPQRPMGGRGFQQPLSMLVLTNTDLQKELKVTDDQKKSLKDVMDKAADLNKKQMELFTGGAPDMDKMQELMKERQKLTEDAKTATDKAFTDDQKKRVKQIDVQRMGVGAFANEDVLKALKPTDDQKAKLKTVSEDFTKAATDLRGEYFQQGQFPDMDKMAEFQKKSAALTSETMEKAKKELTDDQKKAWKDLVGETFDVSKLQFRPMRRDN